MGQFFHLTISHLLFAKSERPPSRSRDRREQASEVSWKSRLIPGFPDWTARHCRDKPTKPRHTHIQTPPSTCDLQNLRTPPNFQTPRHVTEIRKTVAPARHPLEAKFRCRARQVEIAQNRVALGLPFRKTRATWWCFGHWLFPVSTRNAFNAGAIGIGPTPPLSLPHTPTFPSHENGLLSRHHPIRGRRRLAQVSVFDGTRRGPERDGREF